MSKHKTIKVVSVPAGKQAFIKEISTGLESLQAEVGGYIQALYPYEDEVALICNDEGKLMNLPLNRALKMNGMAGNEIYDIIAGVFLSATHHTPAKTLKVCLITCCRNIWNCSGTQNDS